MLIRQEREEDYQAVYQLVKEAFAAVEHRDGTEQDLVAALRKGTAFVPELSLVAEQAGRIVGHILFTKAKVGEETVLVLAPLAVLPEYQNQGAGTALVEEGHERAREMGFGYSLVLGSDTYYPRFGYVPAHQLGVEGTPEFPPANFMGIKLREKADSLRGAVIYPREFGI